MKTSQQYIEEGYWTQGQVNQVVTTYMYEGSLRPLTWGQMHDLFRLFADKTDWKQPIDNTIVACKCVTTILDISFAGPMTSTVEAIESAVRKSILYNHGGCETVKIKAFRTETFHLIVEVVSKGYNIYTNEI